MLLAVRLEVHANMGMLHLVCICLRNQTCNSDFCRCLVGSVLVDSAVLQHFAVQGGGKLLVPCPFLFSMNA